MSDISLDQAQQILEAALSKASEIGSPRTTSS